MNIREATRLMLDGEIVTHESFAGFEAIGVVFRHNSFIRIDKDAKLYDVFEFDGVIEDGWYVYTPKIKKWLWVYINYNRVYSVTAKKYATEISLSDEVTVYKVVCKIEETGEYL